MYQITWFEYTGRQPDRPANSHHASQALNLQTDSQAVKQTDNLTKIIIAKIALIYYHTCKYKTYFIDTNCNLKYYILTACLIQLKDLNFLN